MNFKDSTKTAGRIINWWKALPMLKAGEQSLLMKKLILEYFREEGF